MDVKINDRLVNLPDGSTVSDALAAMEISPVGIATAVNGTVVPALKRSEAVLNQGDSIVVIKAFYGG